LNPSYCVLTSIAGYLGAGNTQGDPMLLSAFFNGARGVTVNTGGATFGFGSDRCS
jgi:hypothetical protein